MYGHVWFGNKTHSNVLIWKNKLKLGGTKKLMKTWLLRMSWSRQSLFMPIILESEVMYRFRYSASKLTLRSSSPKLETLTSNTPQPKSLTLSLQAPIPSSPSPKDSYGLSLTSSAPICQNHNLYTSPLITEQGEHRLKINLFLNPIFLFWKSLFSILQHISVVGRRYLWESRIANDDSLVFSLSIVPIVRELWVNYFKKNVELEHCEGIASVRNIQNKWIFILSNSIMFKRFLLLLLSLYFFLGLIKPLLQLKQMMKMQTASNARCPPAKHIQKIRVQQINYLTK